MCRGQSQRESRRTTQTCPPPPLHPSFPFPCSGVNLLRAILPSTPSKSKTTWNSDAEGSFKGLRISFTRATFIKELPAEWQTCWAEGGVGSWSAPTLRRSSDFSHDGNIWIATLVAPKDEHPQKSQLQEGGRNEWRPVLQLCLPASYLSAKSIWSQ